MKKLNVESNKSFYHGFVLTEQELRRFNDLILEQVKKDNIKEVAIQYTVIFENGVVEETSDLEEILSLENSGSTEIIELSIKIQSEGKGEVKLFFANIDSNNVSSEISIKYNISGISRDWVFITSSLLDERIKKIKRSNINFTGRQKQYRFIFMLLFPLMMLIGLFYSALTGSDKRAELLSIIEKDWKLGNLKDPIDALLRIENNKLTINPDHQMEIVFACFGGLVLFLVIAYIYLLKFYPIFNFCWGDYAEKFKRKESTRKFVNIVIIIGLLISVVGSLIANRILG